VTDQPPRRVALVGANLISHIHAEALHAIRNVRLSAIADPSSEAADRLARRRRCGRVFSSADGLIADGEFDCAHVLVPPDLHRRTAQASSGDFMPNAFVVHAR